MSTVISRHVLVLPGDASKSFPRQEERWMRQRQENGLNMKQNTYAAPLYHSMIIGALAVTLVTWLGWVSWTPANFRIALLALMHWGVPSVLLMTLSMVLAGKICSSLHTPPHFYPFLTGLIAGLPSLVLELCYPGTLPLSSAAVGIAFMAAALLSKTVVRWW